MIMKYSVSLQAIRASVFLQVPQFSMELADSIHKIIPDVIPSVVGNQPQIVDDVLLPPGSWFMRSSSGKTKLLAFQNKIDFIVNAENVNAESVEFWTSFCSQANDVFNFIIRDKTASRLAVAPVFFFQSSDELWLDFIKKANIYNSFKSGTFKDGSFSQTYCVEETIGDIPYLVNYISNFYRVSKFILSDKGESMVQSFKAIEFDINTIPEGNYQFRMPAVKDFFDKASDMSLEFLNYYFAK